MEHSHMDYLQDSGEVNSPDKLMVDYALYVGQEILENQTDALDPMGYLEAFFEMAYMPRKRICYWFLRRWYQHGETAAFLDQYTFPEQEKDPQ